MQNYIFFEWFKHSFFVVTGTLASLLDKYTCESLYQPKDQRKNLLELYRAPRNKIGNVLSTAK